MLRWIIIGVVLVVGAFVFFPLTDVIAGISVEDIDDRQEIADVASQVEDGIVTSLDTVDERAVVLQEDTMAFVEDTGVQEWLIDPIQDALSGDAGGDAAPDS